MKKLLLILAVTFALCGPVSAQSITANPFPGFGTTAGAAIQGPGVLGAATATTLAIGGCTIGTDGLCVTGTATISGIVTAGAFVPTSSSVPLGVGIYTSGAATLNFATGGSNRISIGSDGTLSGTFDFQSGRNMTIASTGKFLFSGRSFLTSGADGAISLMNNGSTIVTTLSFPVSNSLQLGAADVDTAPVAQTLRTQGALAGGTSNVAGANWTFIASPGKGTGAGGSIIFQTTPAGSTGTAVNAPVTALTIDSTKLATFSGQINVTAMTQTSAAQSGTNCYNSGTGAMTYDATLGCLTSLEETKNIQPGGIPEALPEIMALKPFWFTWKDKKLHQDINQQPGLGAHATEKVDVRLVGYGPDGKLRGVRYTEMVALLVAGVQQQQAEIASLGAMRQCKNLYIRGLACW